jgi:carbamate kinase
LRRELVAASDLFWRISMRRTAVVALGGNAFTREGQRGTYAEQAGNALAMAHSVNALIQGGWNVAIVHGNGPQVGSLAIQQEESAALVPAQPLFALDAMTEAQLGSMIALSLRRVSRGQVEAVAVVTHTVVSMQDPSFLNPTKPIGPFLTAEQVKELADIRGWTIAEDAGRGYRRMVPSPTPVSIVESAAIRTLIASGAVVIAAGGGGIPVVAAEDGYVGVDAVVDKDYAAEQLATSIGADTLILVTAVEQVHLNFGTPQQRALDLVTCAEAERWLAEGQFPAGSMGPKVHAAIRFLKNGGRRVVITTPELAAEALEPAADSTPRVGTTIVLSDSLAAANP